MHNNSIIKGDNYEHLHVPLLPVWLLNFCIIATSHSAWYSCFVHLSCRYPLKHCHPSSTKTHQNHTTASIQLTLHPFAKPSSWTTLSILLALPCLFHIFIIRLSSFLLLASDIKWWTKSEMQSVKEQILASIAWEKNPELYLSCNESPF